MPPTLRQVPCESGVDQTKHSGSYLWGVCSQGELTWFGTFTQAALFWEGCFNSPAIFTVHLPTPLPTSPRSLVIIRPLWFFKGSWLQGQGSGLPQCHPHDPGEAVSPVSLKRGTWGLQFWGGEHVPITSPRGWTDVSSFFPQGNWHPVGEGGLELLPMPSMEVTTLLALSLELSSSLVVWGRGLPFVGGGGGTSPTILHRFVGDHLGGGAQEPLKKMCQKASKSPHWLQWGTNFASENPEWLLTGVCCLPNYFLEWVARSVPDMPMWVCWRCHYSPGCQSTTNWKVTKLELGSRSESLKGLSPKTLFTQNRVLETLTMLLVSWSQCPLQGLWGMVVLDVPCEGDLDEKPGGWDIGPQQNCPRTRFSHHQKKKSGKHAMAVLLVWSTHHLAWVGTGVVPHTYMESNPVLHLSYVQGPLKCQNGAKNEHLSVCTPDTPLFSGGITCPSISRQGTSPERCAVKTTEIAQWVSKQWAPEVNPKLDFQKMAWVGTWTTPPGGKWVGQELVLLQAASGCQSPLWAVTLSCSHWYNYLTLACMC